MHTEESLMALANAYADAWHRDESIVNPRSFKSPWKEAALRFAIREVLAERDERPTKRLWDETATALETLRVKFHNVNAECERLRKDAERYRWLRGSADVPSHSVRWGRWEINHWEGANGWRNLLCSELDAAIDAAMQEKKE